MSEHKYPTREQWARSVRSTAGAPDASWRVAAYLSPDELSNELARLHERRRTLLRAAQRTEDPSERDSLRDRRRRASGAIRHLKAGIIPPRSEDGSGELSDIIHERQSLARRAAWDRHVAECAVRPIDDAAWAKELERRERVERHLSEVKQ